MIIEGNVITADEGMTLTNGSTYSKQVYLGTLDRPENWQEIPDEDVPGPDDLADRAEAFDILMGVME
jgi:hypothetical protein